MRKDNIFQITLFLIGVVSVLGFKAYSVHKAEASFVPKNLSYQIDPPQNATSGQITDLSGDVKKFSRTGIDFETTKIGEKVLLGEQVATGVDGKTTIEFPDLVELSFDPNTQAAFPETAADKFSIRQTDGTISYVSQVPVFVRSMHMILELNGKAKVLVDKDNDQIVINILSGSGTVAMMDNDNNTHKWDLKPKQKASIDDDKRSLLVTP